MPHGCSIHGPFAPAHAAIVIESLLGVVQVQAVQLQRLLLLQTMHLPLLRLS